MNYLQFADYEKHLKMLALSEDELRLRIICIEAAVRIPYQHAKLMYSTDRKGKITHVGVYDCQLLLNERHNFNSNKQYAPQLLGKRNAVVEGLDNISRLRIELDTWIGAVTAVSRIQKSDTDADSFGYELAAQL